MLSLSTFRSSGANTPSQDYYKLEAGNIRTPQAHSVDKVDAESIHISQTHSVDGVQAS